MTDIIDDMKREDNLLIIGETRDMSISYIEGAREFTSIIYEYRNLVKLLFDIIDDYERGNSEEGLQKVMKLREKVRQKGSE
ncbi:MAG: hypothetical protein PHG61_07240 [Candidatus Marinimicrobia bacterium]|nr:hypothetical protein [Candidatus Neomarinimicrobiota bacterium]